MKKIEKLLFNVAHNYKIIIHFYNFVSCFVKIIRKNIVLHAWGFIDTQQQPLLFIGGYHEIKLILNKQFLGERQDKN
jgi:hypothetical protein